MTNLMPKMTLSSVLVLLLASCTGESDDVSQAVDFDPVKDQFDVDAFNVGSIANASAVRNAVLLGAKHVNQAGGILGGKNLNMIASVAADAEESVKIAQQLMEYDIQVLNVSFSSRSKAVAEIAIPRGLLVISESASSTFFTTFADNDRYFRMAPSDKHQGQVLAELALELGASTAATVFNENDQYGETLSAEFSANFIQSGGTLNHEVAVPFAVTSGFDSFFAPLVESQPDVIVNTLLDASISANFVNEARAFNLSGELLMSDTSAGQFGFTNSIANFDVIDGALGTTPGFGFAQNPQMQFFADAYRAQYGIEPEGFTVNGYDFSLLIGLAIEHAGQVNHTHSPTALMIRDSLRTVMNPPGTVVGPTNYAEGLQMIRNGEDVDFNGAYGATDFDENGDIVGEITYDVLKIDAASGGWISDKQVQIFVPLK